MPNWKLHLEVANRISKKINLNADEHKLFLLGNIIPDVNNGHLVKSVSKIIDHEITHFVTGDRPSYENFYDKYSSQMKNDILTLGYFIHLYVDYTWNNNFYTQYREPNIDKYTRVEFRIIKQSDFRIYNNKYKENIIDSDDYDGMCKATKVIEEINVDSYDIKKTIDRLKAVDDYKGNYVFYTEEKLDELLDNTIENLCKMFDEIKLI